LGSVSVIGLSKMGSVLAQTLLCAGKRVMVYNEIACSRRTAPQQGATVAAGVTEAIGPSLVSLVSISDYHAAEAVQPGRPRCAARK